MPSKVKKSRKSNHDKKSWKNIDLSEIDQYYQDKELDERTGFTGKEVFTINKEGDTENFNKKVSTKKKEIDSNEEENLNKQKLNIFDNLKCFRHVGSNSAVPAFKPNITLKQKIPAIENLKQIRKSKRIIEATEKRLSRKEKNKKNKEPVYDIWEEKDKTPIGDVYVDYAEDFEKVRLSRIFKCPPKTNKNSNKPTLLPAVEEPHPGLSYNPNKEEHDELLICIAAQKKKKINEKNNLNKKMREFSSTSEPGMDEIEDLDLIIQNEEENKEENEEEINDNKDSSNKVVIISDLKRRKSKKQLRHEIKTKIEKLESKKKKDLKKFESDFTKIKQFIKLAKAKEESIKNNKKLREQKKIEKLYKPANLGRHKYTEPDPEFCLKEELNGSLRKINTDGNLLEDRFKSLQRRNLIEHRRVQLKKRIKAKRKKVIRSSIFNQDLFAKKSENEN